MTLSTVDGARDDSVAVAVAADARVLILKSLDARGRWQFAADRVRAVAAANAGHVQSAVVPSGGRCPDGHDHDDDVAYARMTAAAETLVDQDPGYALPSWVVYAVDATEVEFWQGSPDRNHQRLRYVRVATSSGNNDENTPGHAREQPTAAYAPVVWKKERLYP
ncbi:Pyridoxine 5'-phosphate oxidase, dimerization [Niveomyces insectorum RCEF 264]|uniref:Pyridoxine 5'-phosphate oxidase, dimerization n=1 Tax=Niveomyces insectorum RCEF 264 TaxID=1081102 RepID=A0A167XX72_9HYPO|nr:Pyridoxine 5'-phosphate oxidase, dimerization [Niveomyces insectorum RCEF 264]